MPRKIIIHKKAGPRFIIKIITKSCENIISDRNIKKPFKWINKQTFNILNKSYLSHILVISIAWNMHVLKKSKINKYITLF